MGTRLDVEVLRRGSRGVFVDDLQQELNRKLRPTPNLKVDGIFGGGTDRAVRAYQRQEWLVVDGVAGPCTWAAVKGWETYRIAHHVNLIPQPTGDTCWAAATGMLLGRRGPVPHGGGADTVGGLTNDSDTNDAQHTTMFAKAWGLTLVHGQSWTVDGFAQLMRGRGPLMLNILWDGHGYVTGEGSPGHMVVVSGIRGAGGDTDTTIRIHDPWPPGKGTIRSAIYGPFMRRYPTSTYQIFHR